MFGFYQHSRSIRSTPARYALGLFATAVALVGTLVLRRDGPTPSFLFFVPAVAVAAWYGGRGPSTLTTLLSLLLIDLNFLAPGGSLALDRIEGLEIIAFIIVAVTITLTMEALHRALAIAEQQARELKVLNDEVGRSYDAEREKRHDAELLANAREDVLGLVAHDLRNPLNLITTTTEMLRLEPRDHVLEVGTGSGYQAAILAELAKDVVTIEIIKPLAQDAAKRLERLGYRNITVLHGDGYFGWESAAPYDAIIVTAAATHVPPPLVAQLKPGGRMAIPVGETAWTQNLLLIEKDKDGKLTTRNLLPVRFVPLTRER